MEAFDGRPIEKANCLQADRLTLKDTIAQSFGFLAPVMSIAYLTPLIAGGAGGAVPLAIILGGIGVIAIGLIIARFAMRYPHAGAFYEYTRRAYGPVPGFISGWVYFFGTYMLSTAIMAGIGGFVSALFAQYKINVPWIPITVAIAVIAFALGYFDVRIATRAQLGIILVSMTLVALFSIYVIFRAGSANSVHPFLVSSSPTGLSGIAFGMIYAFLIFAGFESSATLAEETKNPHRALPITIVVTVALAVLYYVLTSYAQAIGFGAAHADQWATSPSPLFFIGQKFGNDFIVLVLNVAAIVDAIGVAIACSVAATRLLYSLGRDGVVPKIVGSTHPKHKTPWVSALVVLGSGLIIDLALSGMGALPEFGFLSGIGGLAIILVYLSVAISGFTLDRGKKFSIFKTGVLSVVGIFFTGFAIYASVWPVPPYPQNLMPYVLLGWIAIGGVLVAVHKRNKVPAMMAENLAVDSGAK